MTNANNITNQIKPHNMGVGNAQGLSGAAAPGKGKAEVNGLGDFIALLIQNIQQTSEVSKNDSGNVQLKTQIQGLLEQSPDNLKSLLEDSEQENPLLSLLEALNIKPEDIGLNVEKLPQSLIGQATALQAQLLAQPLTESLSQETKVIIPESNLSGDGIEVPVPELPSIVATNEAVNTPLAEIALQAQETNKAQNQTALSKQDTPAQHTHTDAKNTLSHAAGVSSPSIISGMLDADTAIDAALLTGKTSAAVNDGNVDNLSGQVNGNSSHAVSFNAGDVLKSFLPDGAGRKPRHATNVVEQAKTISSVAKSNVQPTTGNEQQATTQQPVPNIQTADTMNSASSNAPFMAGLMNGLMSSDAIIADGFSNQSVIQNTSGEITSDVAGQNKTATQSNFTASIMGKSGTFQSPASQKIYMNMQRNAAAKVEQITLQLEPADLGRIEINMKFGKDGSMKAHLIVEKQDTMGLLQRDAHALENALKSSGIELDDSALSFDLASSEDHFDKTQEQSENDSQFLLEMMAEDAIQTQLNNEALAMQMSANQNGYIRQDSVNILI